MPTQPKPDREKCQFLASGMLSFPALFPGQAVESQKAGSKAYKLELITPQPSQQLINAVSYVASLYDSASINPATGQPLWARHVFGPTGRLKRLEEYPRRKPETYPYAVGQFVIGMSKTVSLKSLKMEGQNMSDPLVRAEYDRRVNAAAPKVVKFLNPNDPLDLQWVAEENQRRQFSNSAPITDAMISKTTRPIRSEEIWPGCQVQVFGRAYWDDNVHKTVLLALEQVCLIAPGDRLVAGEADPDQVFGAFAPTAELAPAAFVPAVPVASAAKQDDPWAAFR